MNAAAQRQSIAGNRKTGRSRRLPRLAKATKPATKQGANPLIHGPEGNSARSAIATRLIVANRINMPLEPYFLAAQNTAGIARYIWTSKGRLHNGPLTDLMENRF